jgi:GNAT superfamily N-acetyltransferase
LSLAYRQAEARDLPFIVDSWVESWRTAHAAGQIPMVFYHEDVEKYVRWFLQRPGVRIYVAHHPDVSSDTRADLYGFLVVEDDVEIPQRVRIRGRWEERLIPADCPIVLYVYVKSAYRRQGIARGLFDVASVDTSRRFLYAAKTPIVSKISLFRNAEWAPLACRFPKN